ncbi:hypothetical protein PPYR_12421 [Photinus pyralis]|uniref:Cerebellar degeneration-related protein 2-like n=1 Tax=Photinus pyralis TaxID=7054 RepID=A0A1Y1N6N0_PHOPY|nr:cerebellar degeneration-related protein 2-like isoform X2 [Photinus pyralis]KAB0795582.1 hypothetical protein PPYR_12421 [Photinus pyralis]
MSIYKGIYDYVQDDYTRNMLDDLQLAAELGKTLLERNKELETSLKQHQNVIEDQTQEIEYLTKQTVALREVNDSRLRIYEQLEVSIQDLERANHRLALENSSDKKQLKNLTANLEALEIKCEELQGTIDHLTLQLESEKRRQLSTPDPIKQTITLRHTERDEVDASEQFYNSPKKEENQMPKEEKSKSSEIPLVTTEKQDKEKDDPDSANEQVTELMVQLRESRTSFYREQRRVSELEEQLSTMIHQNQTLEKQLVQLNYKEEEPKSMHEELTTLEEVQHGQLCRRCLRTMDSQRTGDNLSCLGDEAEDDDSSVFEALINDSQYRSSFTMDIQDYKSPRPESNLYRDLVEKYEALLEVQRTQSLRNPKSLQEELRLSGNFNHLNTKDTDEESGHGDSLQPERQAKSHKSISRTPTDFSEAETSSSGFSDETSNKATQTDDRPGSFLCTIADGEDCKFSIYDDASPVDSRFRNRPEYRELFSEIFTVLKKAAENKDEGEELPLLDDLTPIKSLPCVPPVTPATEDVPDFVDNLTDDTQSVISSTMSEVSICQVEPEKTSETPTVVENKKEEPILTPYVRQPLEYLTVSVNVRKRSSSRRKNKLAERSGSPATPIIGSPKVTHSNRPFSGRKRREFKPITTEPPNVWSGNTLHFYSRNPSSPTPPARPSNRQYENNLDYKPSTASQDLFKLKRLDLSYAEVLRNADNKKREREAAARQRRKQ